MKRASLLASLILLFSTLCFAQNTANFSGYWMIDVTKSKFTEKMPYPEMTKIIEQTDSEIKISDDNVSILVRKNQQPIVLKPDWSESFKELPTSKGTISNTVKSGFNKENNFEIIQKYKFANSPEEFSRTETWEMGADEKTLIIKRRIIDSNGEQRAEITFTKEGTGQKRLSSGEIVNGKAIRLIQPPYPPEAKKENVQGTVYVQVLIDEKGNVALARAISGHPLLLAASEKAAFLSKFTQTKIEGVPVKVMGIITYNFIKM